MIRRDRDRLSTLRRRRDFLADRVRGFRGDSSRDKAELGALNWVIRLVEDAERHGVLEDLAQMGFK